MVDVYGLERGLELMMDAGFPAIDLNLGDNNEYLFREDWRETADRIKALADRRGVVFNQAHAPFGGGYAHYTEVLVPQMPRVFAFAGRVGIRQVVVHPLQRGRYYGHEQELFDMNMEFYRSLAPYAREAGVRIAIRICGRTIRSTDTSWMTCARIRTSWRHTTTRWMIRTASRSAWIWGTWRCAGGSRKMLCVSSVTIGWAHCTSMMWTT